MNSISQVINELDAFLRGDSDLTQDFAQEMNDFIIPPPAKYSRHYGALQ
jgi:hypothetical protein